MRRTAETTAAALVPIERYSIVPDSMKSEVEGMRNSLSDALENYYRDVGFGHGDDTKKFDGPISFMVQKEHADLQDTLRHLVSKFGHDPHDDNDLLTFFKPFQIAAFDQVYVEHAVGVRLQGKQLDHDQVRNETKALGLVKSHLLIPTDRRGAEYWGPRYHYPELAHTMWTGRRAAVREGMFSEAQRIHDEIHKVIRPAVEHPSIRAVSRAADIANKVETGSPFNPNEFRKLSQIVASDVAPGVVRYGETVDQIFTAFLAEAAERHLFHLNNGDVRKAAYYQAIFEQMNVEVELRPSAMIADTPAEAFGEEAVETILHQEYGPDNPYGRMHSEPAVTVYRDPETSQHKGAKITVVATAATVAALTVLSPFLTTNHSQQRPATDLSAAEGGIATYVVPVPNTTTTESATPDSTLSPESTTADPQVVVPPVAETPVTAPENDVVTELHPPKAYEDKGNKDRPSPQDIKNIGSLPVVHMGGQATVHSSESSPEKSRDYLNNYAYDYTYPQAKKAYTDEYLGAHPDAAIATDAELATRADKVIQKQIETLKAYNATGKLDKDAYEAAFALLMKASVASANPGLIHDLGLDTLTATTYTNALTQYYLQTSDYLSTSPDAATLNALSLSIASAIEITTPPDAQSAYLQSVGITPEVTNETETTDQTDTTDTTDTNDHDNTHDHGNKHEDGGDKGDKGGDDGTKHNEGTNTQQNTNNTNQNETNTDSKFELSADEKSALDRMEKLGPDWHNRALVMRGLMERGRSAVAASAIIGNTCIEAAGRELNFSIEQYGGGPGRGIVQWGSFDPSLDRFGHEEGAENRVGTLVWYAHEHNLKWTDAEAQIGFIDWELRNTRGAVGAALQNINSIAQATELVTRDYEQPANPDATLNQRISYAKGTYAQFQELLNNVQESDSFDGNFKDRTAIESYLEDKYGDVSGQLAPSDLVTLGSAWGQARLYRDAAFSFRAMSDAFSKEFGRQLQFSGGASDAYRDFATQTSLYADKPGLAAVPGTSNHGWGLAADLGGGVNSGPGNEAYEWLVNNAADYGWGHPDWAKPGGSKPEAWHWEYMEGMSGISGDALTGDVHKNDEQDNASNEKAKVLISQRGYALPVRVELAGTLGTKYEGYSNPALMGNHTGWDFEVPIGTDVFTVMPGVVYSITPDAESGGAGNTIEIQHTDGTFSDYEHLSEIDVKVGDRVDYGTVIAKSGNSGRSEGAHLHITLHEKGVAAYASHSDSIEELESKTIDPADVMPTLEAAQKWLEDHGSAVKLSRLIMGAMTENYSEAEEAAHDWVTSTNEDEAPDVHSNNPYDTLAHNEQTWHHDESGNADSEHTNEVQHVTIGSQDDSQTTLPQDDTQLPTDTTDEPEQTEDTQQTTDPSQTPESESSPTEPPAYYGD